MINKLLEILDDCVDAGMNLVGLVCGIVFLLFWLTVAFAPYVFLIVVSLLLLCSA